MWTPPPDQVITEPSGWKPPSDQVISEQPFIGLGTAFGAAQDLAPWNRTRAATTDALGQKVAEVGGAAGYPTAGAAVGTAIQMSPDILASITSLKGLYNSPNPYAQGITNTPQEIGQQMNAGEQVAGVSSNLPVRSGTMARFPKTGGDVMTGTPSGEVIPPSTPLSQVSSVNPTSYPKNTNSLLNFMQQRITQFGDKLSPQELADYKRILPEMFSKGEIMRGTPQYAMASDIQSQVGNLYNQAIPGRANLNQAYSVSKTLHPEVMNAIKNYVQKYGKAALKEAIGVGLGGGVAYKLFK